MLTYLDMLCGALIARDQAAIERLLTDALAAQLPPEVRREVEEFLAWGSATRSAPIQTLHHYYQCVQLSRSGGIAAPQPTPAVAAVRAIPRESQIELPLFAA